MDVEFDKINITDINCADYNPRRISESELLKLANSMDTFGVVDPIIINLKNNRIIGGHQRYDVLLDKYMKEGNFLEELHLIKLGDIGWVFPETDLTVKSEDHEKALNLALNKITGEWDKPKLQELLEDLSIEGFDIDLTGFDEMEFEEYNVPFENIDYDDDEIEEDDYNAPDDLEVNVEMGDVFKLGNHVLVCGDSTVKEYIDKLLKIGGGKISIDLLFTDPPYGMFLDTDYSGMEGISKGNKYKKVIGDNEDFTPQLINTVFENFDKCKEIFLWGADYYAELIPNRNDGSWIVWDKMNNGEGPNDAYDKMFGSNFELCWSKARHKRALARVLWKGIFGLSNEDTKRRVHPTQKPVLLVNWFLEKFSKEGDNVLDLFGGSGSTLIACEQTNRNCYMMELDPYYCQIIINRWEEFTGQKAEKIN